MTSSVTQGAFNEALQRAKEIAASQPLKRPLNSEPEGTDAKRMNLTGQFGGSDGGDSINNVTEVVQIPDSTVGLVIGRGGEQISQIQAQSGARVQMAPSSNGNNTRECTVQGTRQSVDHARQLIMDVISRQGQNQGGGMGGMGGGGGSITVDVLIPGTKCGLVIGKAGETIKYLQQQSGAKMVMIQETNSATGQAKPLRITGTPQTVDSAKRLVDEILNSREDGMGGGMGGGPGGFGGQGMSAKGEVLVPRSAVGIIIGKGGETIKRLGMETGTKIQFKPDDDPNTPDRCATITGTRDQIFRATELITQLVQKSADNGGVGGGGMGGGGGGGVGGTRDTFFMHVPANKTGLVIGKGGETIKQINAESGAHCELSRDAQPNPNEKIFVIKGSPYQIHTAQHIIRIKVGDVPPGTPVPPFNGPGGPGAGGPPAGGNFQGGGFMNPQYPQQQQQWPQQNYGGQQGWPQMQQPQQPAQMNYYDQNQMQQQQQQYQQPMQPAVQQQPQQVMMQQTAAQPQPQAAPAGGAAAGQPDYSAQWAEYYRSMGMHDQAALIEQQIAQKQGGGGGAPVQQQPAAGGMPYGQQVAGRY